MNQEVLNKIDALLESITVEENFTQGIAKRQEIGKKLNQKRKMTSAAPTPAQSIKQAQNMKMTYN